MLTQEAEMIRRDKKAYQEELEIGKALNRLKNNKDFQTVILKGYFQDEAVRLVHLKSDPDQRDAESQKVILNQIDAIGNFYMYCSTISNQSKLEASISACDEMLESIHEREGED